MIKIYFGRSLNNRVLLRLLEEKILRIYRKLKQGFIEKYNFVFYEKETGSLKVVCSIPISFTIGNLSLQRFSRNKIILKLY